MGVTDEDRFGPMVTDEALPFCTRRNCLFL